VDLGREQERLVQLSETAPSLFPQVLTGSTDARQQRRAEAETAIADVSQIIGFYHGLASPDPRSPFPDSR